MENNKKYTGVIIGLLVIAALILYQNAKLERVVEDMQNRISNMESNINHGMLNMSNTMVDRVESILNEQQNMVSDYKSTYRGVDTQSGAVKTLVAFTLKQSVEQAKVYLHVSTENNTNEDEYECVTADSLNYTCEVELAYTDNYLFDMYQKSEDGSYKKLNSTTYPHHVKSDCENRVSLMESGISTDKEKTDYSFTLQNKTFGEQSFQVKNVVVKAFYENKEVFVKDVTGNNIVNSEEMDRMRLMIASGEMNPSEIPEAEYSEIATDENGDEYGVYTVSILHSETGAPVEYNEFPEYQFKVMVTFNDGNVVEL